ncbi:hypothetical protein F4T81_03515 [Acinetobacter nosocomialis]|uniref:hypothetical protein n=1 Tax=Acinetobacter nosocomialis TaxID=106654 RepID=UPI0012986945|nr:hypothetical protein [Acinetobacter nosocomialis]MRA09682.1 hypothetical protein [Acinetobacter nosocomialis]
MNNKYIQNASAFLDSLVEDMNIELFIEQYQKLNHEHLSHSIPLKDERITNYYLCYLKHSKKSEDKTIWNSVINKNLELSHKIMREEIDACQINIVSRSHHSLSRNSESLSRLLNTFSVRKQLKVSVSKEKYETYDFEPSLAA